MEKKQLQSLVKKGYSTRIIAKQLNSSQTNVRYWLHKYNIQTYNKSKYIKSCKCIICGETNSINFYKKLKQKCKKCMLKEDANRKRQYKITLINKLGSKCIKCGYNKCTAALEFHHPNSSKKDPNYTNMRNWSDKRK